MKAKDSLVELTVPLTLQKKILIFVIILYPVLFIFQGGDLTDAGFFALSYQNFFYNLNFGETNSISILSDFIGASWLVFFPKLGILGLKILTLIFLYLVIGMIFSILKDFTENRLLLLFGIFCGVVFSTRFSLFVLGRDDVSWFFLILTSFFTIKGLRLNRNIFFCISGIFFVFASFSRFPNIVFSLFLPFILAYFHFYKSKAISFLQILTPLKQYFSFVLGSFSSLLVILVFFKYLNIYDIFLNNLDFISDSADSTYTSSYSFFQLFKSYFIDCVFFIPHLVSIIVVMFATSLVYAYSSIKNIVQPFFLFIIIVFIFSFIFYSSFSYSSNIKYLVPGFCSFPLMLSVHKKDKFSLLVVLYCFLMITQVAGSNTGLFLKFSPGFMVLIPLSLLIFSEKRRLFFCNVKIYTRPIFIFGMLLIIFLSVYARLGFIYHVDSGIACRLRCIYPIEHKKMLGIFTTKENANHIQNLSIAIERNISSDKNLFIYGHQPMFYYLTESFPPVKKTWLINNYVKVDELFTSLENSIKSSGRYPTIVDTKQRIMGEKGQKRLEYFLKEYEYECKERTDNFDIWIKKL